jgi:hypothetical protein
MVAAIEISGGSVVCMPMMYDDARHDLISCPCFTIISVSVYDSDFNVMTELDVLVASMAIVELHDDLEVLPEVRSFFKTCLLGIGSIY